jgi:hypothetical protein
MTIPASSIVKINPGVVSAGGAGLVLNGLFLTENLAMPTGVVLSFASTAAVAAFFGAASAEALLAPIYFSGYQGATLSPSAMLFATFNAAARAAFLNSGSFANIPLSAITSLAAGTLTVNVSGTPETSASINLSGAASFSAAAALIEAGFTSPGFTVTWSATTSQFVFTNTATGSSSTLSFATTDALATGLQLTQATGAILSQGAVADTPATAMTNAYNESQNWATMVTLFEPNLATKELFAIWFNSQDNQFLWVAWDSDTQASVQGATEPFGVVAAALGYNGVACIGGDPAAVPAGTTLGALVLIVAVFIAGSVASINFGQTNGRRTFAFLIQSGMVPTCANQQTAANLLANGYSFYGAYTTRNQGFVFFYNGQIPGEFDWIDTFIDDVWMNDQFQVTLLSLLTSVGSIAYNQPGYGIIRTALVTGPIAAALNFGAIRTGVVLSAIQIADVNQLAGGQVDQTISTQGYYLQILDPGAVVRQERGTPILNFFYADGGSVQMINLNSDDIL